MREKEPGKNGTKCRKDIHTKSRYENLASRSSKCKASVVSASPTVMEQTSWTVEEIIGHEISTVITLVYSAIPLPISMATELERDGSDASLFLTCYEESFGELRAVTAFPFLDTEITELVLATTSGQLLAFWLFFFRHQD